MLPELCDEHRDGTVFADVQLALWAPCPEWMGGGWVVTTMLPLLGPQSERLDAGTRIYGPYVAVAVPRSQEDS